MKVLRTLSRIFVGLVFVFSGFVKAVDPLGSTYKFSDYFNAFHLDFLNALALPLAVFLSAAELLIGISLLLGYRMRIMAWAVLIFMSFFTVLTFILALTNPVTDCGCFGDALILTNWETFWKNVVLMIFTIVIFISRKDYPVLHGLRTEWSLLLLYFLSVVYFSFYNYRHLPLIDFRPYSVGTHIPSAMEIPAGAPMDEYETILIYRNLETQKEKEFSINDFPRDTSKWEFVDSESMLVSKGYEPPIHDFLITNSQNEDITSLLIENKDYNLLMVSYDVETADKKGLQEADKYFDLSLALEDLNFYAVTASSSDKSALVKDSLSLGYSFTMADETMLKTTIRSNPGLILVSEGTILAKWAYRDFPGEEFFRDFPEQLTDFPFCEGCDLRQISRTPEGYAGDRYETVLYYRNTSTGDSKSFSMEDFPRDESLWMFERADNTRIPGEFDSPLETFRPVSPGGVEFRDLIINDEGMSLLFFIKDPGQMNADSLDKINKLAALAPEFLNEPVNIYGLTAAGEESLNDFKNQNIILFDFLKLSGEAMEQIKADDLMVLLISDGSIRKRWQDKIPSGDDIRDINPSVLPAASKLFLPSTLTQYRSSLEERLIYLFMMGFLVSVFIIRTVLYSRRKM